MRVARFTLAHAGVTRAQSGEARFGGPGIADRHLRSRSAIYARLRGPRHWASLTPYPLQGTRRRVWGVNQPTRAVLGMPHYADGKSNPRSLAMRFAFS